MQCWRIEKKKYLNHIPYYNNTYFRICEFLWLSPVTAEGIQQGTMLHLIIEYFNPCIRITHSNLFLPLLQIADIVAIVFWLRNIFH